MNKKYLLLVLLVLTVSSTAFFKDAVSAFETNKVTPNEMTVQDSREIYQQKQMVGILLATVSIVAIAIVVRVSNARKNMNRSRTKRARKK